MKIAGITAEYNPFHSGHLYHLSESVKITGADGVVVVMSGNFVQRGLPACIDKYRRTRMALENGADIVIELPVGYAVSAARDFAEGAISILHDLGAVTDIICGAEADEGRIHDFKKLAGLLAAEPYEFKNILKAKLKEGCNYPSARQAAIDALEPGLSNLITTPNNILALEYEQQLIKLGSHAGLRLLTRSGGGYHETGTAIRAALKSNDSAAVEDLIPQNVLPLLDYYIEADDLSPFISYRLIMMSRADIAGYYGISQDLASRIFELRNGFRTFSELSEAVRTKNTTGNTVNRALIRLLLGIREKPKPLPHLRVLGFKKSSGILKELKNKTARPLVARMSDVPDETVCDELTASDVYNRIVYDKTGVMLPDEYHVGPVVVQ